MGSPAQLASVHAHRDVHGQLNHAVKGRHNHLNLTSTGKLNVVDYGAVVPPLSMADSTRLYHRTLLCSFSSQVRTALPLHAAPTHGHLSQHDPAAVWLTGGEADHPCSPARRLH